MSRSTLSAVSLAAVSMLALAGCQSDGGVDALDVNAQANEPVKLSELRKYCPKIELREGTAYFNTYRRGAKDDPSKIVYQASISDVTRRCTSDNGMMSIDVAVAGRIVPGPEGKAGTVTMPIRVVVVQGSEVLYTKLTKYPVAISDTIGATQFVFNDPAVTIPVPTQQNILIFAGYDEGPPK